MEQTLDAPSQSLSDDIYAGFWLRVVACLIDSFIVSFVLMIIILPFMFGLGIFSDLENIENDATAIVAVVIMVCVSLLATIGVWLYFAVMESGKNQATLGKMALGIKVTGMKGEPITFWRALGRTVAKLLSGILYIGYIMVAFTDKKQGLHDMIAECLVVKKNAKIGE